MNKLKFSIQIKVTFLLALLAVLFITILYLTIEKIVTNDISKIEHQKAEIILKTIEPTIAVNHFLELNKENREFIKKLFVNKDILGIYVHFYNEPFYMKKPEELETQRFELEYPIKDVVTSEDIGTIVLYYTKKHYNKTVKKIRDRFILISLMILAVVIFLYFAIRYMFKSLTKISEVIANYKIGDSIDFSHIKPDVETDKIMSIITNLVKRINQHSKQMHTKQEELEEARKNAEAASRFKSEFLANMSHEIRTPMNGVLGFVDQLSKGEDDPERLNKFNIIKNSGETLLSIINDILDFSKIETGKMELDPHPNNAKKLFKETADIFSEIVNSKNIKFNVDIDDELPNCLIIDPLRLKQVVFNLLSNAVKFTDKNGVVNLNVDFDRKKNSLYCSVLDTGIGIVEENQSKIFDAFDQEDSSTTRKFGGTGLGLSISSKLVDMMGGKLEVYSELGKGSKFYFTIPVENCEEDLVLNSDLSQDNSVNKVLPKSHILIVEDNKTNQLLMSMILDELGLTYDIANDGLESVELYKEHSYQVILMDENMPNMNGIEATKKIRQIEREHSLEKTPIIAVTANAMREDRERFIESGMDEYISKPYTEESIIGILKQFL